MPVRPLLHGCAAIHSIVSYPSSPVCGVALWKYSFVPCERCRSRMSCSTTA
jgi:hypothetical protein